MTSRTDVSLAAAPATLGSFWYWYGYQAEGAAGV